MPFSSLHWRQMRNSPGIKPSQTKKLCSSTTVPLSSKLKVSVRQSVPCERNETRCWCLTAVAYTNDVRRARGLSILSIGPENQLTNANNYAEKLSRRANLPLSSRLEHQDLAVANLEIGCGRAIGGENLA